MKDALPAGTTDTPAPSTLQLQPPVFLLAVWFGLLTGIGEVCLATIRPRWWIHPDSPLTQDYVWMTPLADVFLFSLIGLVLYVVARRWPRLATLQNVVFVYAFLGALSLMLMLTRLHWAAQYLLALGVAVQAARLVHARSPFFARVLRLTTGWTRVLRLPRRPSETQDARATPLPGGLPFFVGIVSLLILVGLGMHGWQRLNEQRAVSALAQAPPDAPNVLLLVLDTVRAKSLSLYGAQRPTTPHLDRWAQQGVVFDGAMSTAPWTLPAHASMFTGRWTHEMETGFLTPFRDPYPTLAEALDTQGYKTAGFVSNVVYCSYKYGLDRGFLHYEDYPVSAGQLVLHSSLGRTVTSAAVLRDLFHYRELLNRKSAEAINTAFLDWHQDQDEGPFFAFLNYFDAHEPYLPPAPYDVKFGARGSWDQFVHTANRAHHDDKESMPPEEAQAILDLYEGAITYLDDQLNLLFEELDRRGVLDNTLVIITSDHGEQFGEHGMYDHANSLYQPLLHVPLLMRFPAQLPAGETVSDPVSLRDLPATVLDLAGLEDPVGFPGRSLARFWTRPVDSIHVAADTLIASHNRMHTLFLGPYKYIHRKRGKEDPIEELFQYRQDPEETQDLAATDEGRQLLPQFRRALQDIVDAP